MLTSSHSSGRISTFSNHGRPPAGYCLIVDGNGSWFLSNGGKAYGTRDQPYLLASGKLPAASPAVLPAGLSAVLPNSVASTATAAAVQEGAATAAAAAAAAATPYIGTWHTLKLELVGKQVTGTVDGVVVGTVADTHATYTHGMVAIGSGWHLAYFDNFTVDAKTK